MGGREKRENAQRKKCLETDISTTLQAFDASKDKHWSMDSEFTQIITHIARRFYKDSASISLLWNTYCKKHLNQLRLESKYFKDEKSKTKNLMNNCDVLKDGCNITSLPTNSSVMWPWGCSRLMR